MWSYSTTRMNKYLKKIFGSHTLGFLKPSPFFFSIHCWILSAVVVAVMSSVFPFSSFVLHWLFGILRRQKLSHLSPIYLVNNWFILLWDKTYLFYYLEYNSKLMYSSRVLCLLGSPHKFFFFFFRALPYFTRCSKVSLLFPLP